MSAGAQAIAAKPRQAPMSGFERYLTLWVALCIVAGVALGQGLPDVFQAIGRMEVAQVNLPVGLLIWVMIVPMLVKIDFGALHQVKEHWRGIGVTLFVNWAVKPFSMALLGWLFIRQVFAPFLPADQLDSYIAGLILLAAAPCTAMVFVWSRLTNGDPAFHALASGSERRHHDRGLRAHRRPAAGHVLDLGALGHAADFGRALHHRAGDPGAALAAASAQARTGRL